ncbi:MAG: peptidoglycan DD-metalloendopeptidase family protein [Betaproteobacteria bacterium]|nr:peptidoglycan DD-metalloendopeptidase family protein [Betaproteobacteria bacterium]
MRPVLRRAAIGLLAWLAAAPLGAAEKDQLDKLRTRIERLRGEIVGAEESRAEAREELRESELAISVANRSLRELSTKRDGAHGELRRLAEQKRAIEGEIASRREPLGRLLLTRYLHGEPGALRVLASGDDPNRVARELHYVGYVSRAQAGLIESLRSGLERLREVEARTRSAVAELAAIESEQRAERKQRLAQQAERRSVLARVSGQIRAQRRQVKSLERDQARMTRLVEELTRVIAATPVTPARRNERVPEPGSGAGRAFSRLRGSLHLPVRGELSNRFGTPRSDGGPKWKGLFIRAVAGQEVRAVAAGRVVYAEWMRGFGNLLILDHGEGYLTIYGNNEAVLKGVGDAVRAGDTVATVGASGGNAESGLYFEIRHRGQAFDPLKWVSIK